MRSNFTHFCLLTLAIVLAVIFCNGFAVAQDQQLRNDPQAAKELFQAGVTSFQKNELDQAREHFTASLKISPSANTLYNLGLTEFKAKNEGLALGLWRKALAQEPSNTAIQEAIAFAERALPQQPVSKGEDLFESFHQKFLAQTSLMNLAIVNLVFLAFAGWILIRYSALKSRSIENEEPSPPIPYIGFIFVVGLLVSAIVLGAKAYDLTLTRATIAEEKVEVKTSPDSQAATLFELFEGLEVIVRQSHEGWMQVTYPGGLSGWVPAKAVLVSSGRQP